MNQRILLFTMSCTICLEDESTDWILIMKCSHEFHQGCIMRWYKKQHTCPMCRSEITLKYIKKKESYNPKITKIIEEIPDGTLEERIEEIMNQLSNIYPFLRW